MKTEHPVLFSAEEIAAAVERVAAAIDQEAGNDPVVVVAVLKGAVMFVSDLIRATNTPCELAFIDASSYSDDFTPGETLKIQHESDVDIADRHVVIVDDIVDTGRTLQAIADLMRSRGASRVTTAALISKTSRRSGAGADHHGFEIGEELIYGYGMDWNERHRDLPYVAVV
jgi:hypoxanthine phosphoribosyltransferase